jgi:hypothetical protein
MNAGNKYQKGFLDAVRNGDTVELKKIVGFHIPKKFYFKGKKSSSLSEIDNIKKLVNFIHHSIINRF